MLGLQDEEIWPGVDEVVEAFESAQARDGSAEVAAFAPAPGHPEGPAILSELIRVDLEYRWTRGQPRRLEDYLALFPGLSSDPGLVRAMAFEEYRLRLQAGEAPTPEEYRLRFGLDDRDWPLPAIETASPPDRPTPEMGRGGETDLGTDDDRFSVERSEFLRELDRTDPWAAESLARALANLPRVGGRFLGFRLCGELGRGAFGRVYLARQGDLADRLVALKVSADAGGESRALAQLQHTNVVPIYSVHRLGGLQAVCMPYLGATTLADTLAVLKGQATLPRSGLGLLSTRRRTGAGANHPPTAEGPDVIDPAGPPQDDLPRPSDSPSTPQVERLKGLGYVPAVLWLVERAVDGLAHAHERGILHRDLKPANILFSDDGEPLLLDFNLAADTKVRIHSAAGSVGGTLPYMAPEHLAAFRDGRPAVDPRSDVYAMGVILHELLTGCHPFPGRRGPVDDVLPGMIADRLGPPPDVRRANPAIPPAVASIVRHALEPEPSRRYRSAREFQDDLRRQLDDLPLRHAPEPPGQERLAKWGRRHPRLASTTTIGAIAAVMLLAAAMGFAALHRHYRAVEAAGSFDRLTKERRDVVALLTDPDAQPDQVRDGIEACRLAVDRYRVLDDPDWLTRPLASELSPADRDRLREALGDILVRWAVALTWRAAASADPSRAGALAEAGRRLDLAEACYGPGAVTRGLVLARADLALRSGRGPDEVRGLLDRAESIPLRTPRERLEAAVDRTGPGDRRKRLEFLDAASRNDPLDYANWMTLALGYARLGQAEAAAQSYGVAIAMAPQLYWPHFDRGVFYLETGDYPAALADFDRVVALKPDHSSGLLNRALARLGMGDARGAIDDLTRSLDRDGAPTRIWFIRARAKDKLGDREGARLDREEGLRRTPSDEASFVARGLARLPGDPAGALADFDSALALNPRYSPALQDKASVLSETLGRVDEAIKVLDTALEHHPAEVAAVAGRGVLLARLGRRDAALRDARTALDLDARPMTLYQAGCIFALTSREEPADRPEALRLLADAIRADPSWSDVVPKDRDLDPIRERPEFRELLQALAVVRRVGVKP